MRSGACMRCLCVGVVLASLACPVLAQRADRPDVKPGDRWDFAVRQTVASAVFGRTWVVTAVGPESIEGSENGELLRLTPDLNVLESPRTRESNPRALEFPLEVGKRWRYVSEWLFKPKGSRGKVVVDVEVSSYEKLTVHAGEFDCFKLVSRGTLSGTSPIGSRYDAEVTETYWYAPAARAVVKSVRHNPYLGTSYVELVGLDLRAP
jgi:hypothetical protein